MRYAIITADGTSARSRDLPTADALRELTGMGDATITVSGVHAVAHHRDRKCSGHFVAYVIDTEHAPTMEQYSSLLH